MRNIIIISGPSGCGKSTLIHEMLAQFPELAFSVSHTTRPPRPGEVHGQDYFFVTPAQFALMARSRRFAEWAEVHGQRYGTSWKEVRDKSAIGRTLVLDIDVQGARSIRSRFPEAMSIFVVPPTLAALKKRLRQRQARLDLDARRRLGAALRELRAYREYEYVVVNDRVPDAVADLCCLYVSFCRRTPRNGDKINRLLRGGK
jgi:guanylate kinase